jgi:quercetin dioxygenase-like cupin family protein
LTHEANQRTIIDRKGIAQHKELFGEELDLPSREQEVLMTYFSKESLPATEMLPGVTRRAVHLDDVMITFIDFEPNSVVPEHRHPHQQITWVVSGEMEFGLDGQKRVLQAGDGVLVRPDVPHGAVVRDTPCSAIDAWHPVREDYR